MSLAVTQRAVQEWKEKETASGRTNEVIDSVVVDEASGMLLFKIQDGPIKENGVNGCQVSDVIKVARNIMVRLNNTYPCAHNEIAINSLNSAIAADELRTADRLARGVEGFNKA